MSTSPSALPVLDLVIIIVYLAGILAVGIASARRLRPTSQAYFLAGRSLGWGMVGASLFAANISSIHLVGLAASGYNEGLVWGNFEWMAVLSLILLGLVFAPFYFRSRISTLPEFLEKRFGPESRVVLAGMATLSALFIHIGMSIFAAAVVFRQFFGIDVVVSILIITAATGLYTILGGLKAVVVTESIQTVILILGAILVTLCAFLALPAHGIRTLAEFKAAARPGQLTMLQASNSAGLPWYAVLLGYPIMGVWYWCTDQTIVQRVLGAKTERDARLGPLFAGLLKILPVFILVLPGVIGYVLFKDVIGSDANQTLPVLIARVVPTGLRGLISAGVLAALMSTIAAALNSIATLVAVDIVKRARPAISDRIQIRAGKTCAMVVMVLAAAWSTQAGRFSSIFEGINVIASDLAPPITTVFLWGIFWRRGTRPAAFATLLFGFVMGAAAFLVDFPVIGTRKLITDGWGIPFMMQAWWMFCLCSLVFVAVSLMTRRPAAASVDGVSWKSPKEVFAQGRISGFGDPRILAAGLIMILVILYVIFE